MVSSIHFIKTIFAKQMAMGLIVASLFPSIILAQKDFQKKYQSQQVKVQEAGW